MNNNFSIHLFGEVLFDHFPDGSRVLGGAPFNVAWHLQAFGQAPRLVSRIGDDEPGHEIAQMMADWGMSTEALQTDSRHATGRVQVNIENGEPHFQILENCAYDFVDAEALDARPTEGILYHGSLAIRNSVSRTALATLKTRHFGKVFVDVNLRPPWWEKSKLFELLKGANWVKLNEAELVSLTGSGLGLEEAARAFFRIFDLDVLVVTRGALGAVAWNGRDWIAATPTETVSVVDTVGAGDAFASVLLLGFSLLWPLSITLERAQSFAGALVGQRGATCVDRAFYQAYFSEWGLSQAAPVQQ